jgi:NTE family protein
MTTPSIALALGAGGVVGGAYEMGALAALDEVADWDARTAGLIVGTSAGASVAAALRAGFAPADLVAHAHGDPMSAQGEALTLGLPTEPLDLPSMPPRDGLPVPAAPQLLVPALLTLGPFRPALALAGLLPRGSVATTPIGNRVRATDGDPWPQMPTWLCAVRLGDGRRIVFGRDDVDPPDLRTAVEASCAIAGYFEPVRVGREEYIDGGVWSVTNADLVAGLEFDLVVVISPMAVVPPGPPWSPYRWGRRIYAGNLSRELDEVRRQGTRVLDLSPTPDAAERLGRAALDRSRVPDAAREGRDRTRRTLEGDEHREARRLLARAASPSVHAENGSHS